MTPKKERPTTPLQKSTVLSQKQIEEKMEMRKERRRRRKLRARWTFVGSFAGVVLLFVAFLHLNKPPATATPATSTVHATAQAPASEQPPRETGSASAQTASPTQASEETSAASEAATAIAQSEEAPASEAEAPASESELPPAARRANTGEFVQTSQGDGTNHLPIAASYAYPVERIKEAMYGGEPLYPGAKIAFLTYDDGVFPDSTPQLLDLLQEEGVPATFFVIGQNFTEANKDILQRVLSDGHALALHSYDHRYEKLYPNRVADPQEILNQLHQTREAAASVLGSDIVLRVWRYPGGHMSWDNIDAADQALASEGVQWIDWNSTNGDAESPDNQPKDPAGQVAFVQAGWNAYGSPDTIVILMHDKPDKEVTRQSVHAIIQYLREQGFSFGVME